MPLASLYRPTDKTLCSLKYCVCVFYDAKRVLSAIAKFLFTSLGKGRGGVRRDIGEESGERTGRIWRGGKWKCTKIAPKRNQFGICDRPLGTTDPCHTFLEQFFFRDNIYI